MNANDRFDKLKKEMFDRFLDLNPSYASFLGLHDPYDYLLPKGDTSHILANLQLVEDYVARMKEDISYDDLGDASRTDWQVLERSVERGRFEFYEQRQHELDPNAFDMLGSIFFAMITRDYAPLEKRMDALVARLEKVPKYLEEFRTRFENSRPVKLWTEIAIESANQIPGLLEFIAASTEGKIPEDLHNRLLTTTGDLAGPMDEHLAWLQGLMADAIGEWALGRSKFEKLINLRDLGMTSEEILRLGYKYLGELKEERAKIAREINPDKDVAEVMKDIYADAPKTFEEALGATRKAMEEAKGFVVDMEIATIHEEDRLMVEETPAFLAPLIPFAALMMPSRFDKPMIGVYIVTRPKDMANLGKHLNYASIRNTAVHEAFPGHFLQGTISNRSSWVHLLGDGTETTEGWAHYCEEMMAEKGFVTGPQSRLMQVNDAIWRAVRIILDVKLSRGGMNFDEAVEMLVEETGMSEEGAVAEVRRYTQTPGYALSYLLGKHLILELRKDVEQGMGEEFSDRFFHDTITANGHLPISLLRQIFERKTGKA